VGKSVKNKLLEDAITDKGITNMDLKEIRWAVDWFLLLRTGTKGGLL
jgi:hypothetical protein